MTSRAFQFQRRLESRLGKWAVFLLARVIHLLPWRSALALGRGVGRLAPVVSRRHYLRVIADIRQAFGEEARPVDIACRSYQRLGESLMEFLRLPYMSPEEIRRWVTLEGSEHVEAALAQGHGVILLTGHLGNWELCGTMMGLSPYKTTAIAREQADTGFTQLLFRNREKHGLTVVSMTDVRSCIRALQRNECLGVVGDLNAKVPGAFVQFLGRPAATYTGVAYLAITTGAPILPLFDERLPDGTHIVRIGPPIPVVDTGDRPHDLLITTINSQRVIQEEIRRRPHDWFWLLQRWKTRPEDVAHPERVPMEHRDLSGKE